MKSNCCAENVRGNTPASELKRRPSEDFDEDEDHDWELDKERSLIIWRKDASDDVVTPSAAGKRGVVSELFLAELSDRGWEPFGRRAPGSCRDPGKRSSRLILNKGYGRQI